MTAIFSRKSSWMSLLTLLLVLTGCGEREPAVISPPKDVAAVVEPFLKELAAGNKEKTAAHLSPAAIDELDAQFAADHKKLAGAGKKLTPRYVDNDSSRGFGADGKEVNIVYAVKHEGKWTSATVRVYRYRDEPYKVEYWRVTNKAPQQPRNSDFDPEEIAKQQKFMFWLFGGFALLAVLGLIALIWLIKRRPHLVAPDVPDQVRASAATVRDEDA
jgi:predicted small lipoprotein YifL